MHTQEFDASYGTSQVVEKSHNITARPMKECINVPDGTSQGDVLGQEVAEVGKGSKPKVLAMLLKVKV